MPEFDDVTQPPHYRPQLDYNPVSDIDRYTVLLKDGETTATIYPIHLVTELPPGLLAFLCDEFNMEIERGDTFPFFDTLHIETFQNYWFGSFTAVMVLGDLPTLQGARQWEKECLGTFFIKPNYPGRCLHICTAGFLVNAGIRGKGIGRTLADCYLQWAPRLGYTYTIFNLVFESNVAARQIWESLNFKRIGRIKSAGILKGHDTAVDAIMYGRELIHPSDPAIGAYRFDKIKFYLETGKYPAMADRQEKSRLRSSASHYRLENGRLLLKGREVISDPVRQLQICTEIHMTNHGGINKTTAAITEKYHWTRIKDTVATAIKNCAECRDPTRDHHQSQQQNQLQHQQQHHNQHQPLQQHQHHQQHQHQHHQQHQQQLHPQLSQQGHSIPMQPHVIKRGNGNDKKNILMNGIRKQNSSNNVNGRIRNPEDDDVEAIVAAAQLHNLPGRHETTDSLLTHDLSLDDGIIAAVEAAQRSHNQQLQLQQLQRQQIPQQQHFLQSRNQPTYASVAASAVAHDPAFSQFDAYNQDDFSEHVHTSPDRGDKKSNNHDNTTNANNNTNTQNSNSVAVDPQFENHDEGGDEIEIARALIHANEVDDDENNENNKLNNRVDDETNIFFKQHQNE